ncbi:hypothetical protein LguiB_017963 [Lonicera macranthoides]
MMEGTWWCSVEREREGVMMELCVVERLRETRNSYREVDLFGRVYIKRENEVYIYVCI